MLRGTVQLASLVIFSLSFFCIQNCVNGKSLSPKENDLSAISRSDVEESCPLLRYCDVSDLRVLVCGTDNKQYQNVGVLWCARKCNIGNI